MYVSGGSPLFDNVPVWSSEATVAGGAVCVAGGVVTLTTSSAGGTNGTLLNNKAQFGGAVAVMPGASVTMARLRLEGNSASMGGGAVNAQGPLAMSATIIRGNAAHDGGGLSLSLAGHVIEGNWLEGNVAESRGVASNTWGAGGRIAGNVLIGNDGETGGGALIGGPPLPLTFSGNWLERNTAINGGGLLVSDDASPSIDSNGFFTNTARDTGGGIRLSSLSVVTLTNNIIARNVVSATARDGAGVAASGTPMRLINNTIYENRGDGVWFDRADHSRIINNIIAHNHAGTIIAGAGSGIEMAIAFSPTVDYLIDYNDVWLNHGSGPSDGDYTNVEAGMHSMSINPQVLGGPNIMAMYYHLRPTSPVRATGSLAWAPANDVDGQPRGVLGSVSMGADEVLYRGYLPMTKRQ